MPVPELEVAAPRDAARVYWVGHSLMHSVDEHVDDAENVMRLVGRFASSRSQSYAHYDHTYWGAGLHFNWQGKGHWDQREDSKPRADRAYLSEHGSEYDVFVFTDTVPIKDALDWSYSKYYLRKFYCEALQQNPSAEVFLYQGWDNAQPADPSALDFEARVRSDRKYWEELADDALGDKVANPGRLGGLLARIGIREQHCNPTKALRFIPAGSAILALSTELSGLATQAPRLADGKPMRLSDVFANPYINWNEARGAGSAALTLRHPAAEHDDIHASALGSYFVALVAYATIYGADPSGLPTLNGVSEEAAALLQRVAWQAVIGDPRTGVAP